MYGVLQYEILVTGCFPLSMFLRCIRAAAGVSTLNLLVTVRITLSAAAKKAAGILVGIVLNL